MKWRVIIRPNAEADAQEAWSWYESQRTGLGDQFLVEVGNAIRQLETNPKSRPFYYRDFRRLLTRRFFYRIEGTQVFVFRILHAKREHRRQL